MFLNYDQSTMDSSEFSLTILSAIAQEESSNTSKRIKSSKKMNAELGRVPNFVFGYDKIKGDYFNLLINEREAMVVNQIYDMYIHEGHGAGKIATILNERGIQTKLNKKWTQNAVIRILTNKIYCGTIINGKEEIKDFLTGIRNEKDSMDWHVTQKPELRIVHQDIFNQAQSILEQRQNAFSTNRTRHSNKHIFSTLIKCKCCDYSFRRLERKYQNVYVSWVCSGRNTNGTDSCENYTKINEQELIQAIKDYFANILRTKEDVMKSIVKEFNRLYKTKDENTYKEHELKSELARTNRARDKQMEMYTDDLITREELKQNVGDLNKIIKNLENELKLVQFSLNKGDQLEISLKATFEDVETILSMDHMTNFQLKKIIEKIVVDSDGTIDIYLKMFANIGLDYTVPVSHRFPQRCNRTIAKD